MPKPGDTVRISDGKFTLEGVYEETGGGYFYVGGFFINFLYNLGLYSIETLSTPPPTTPGSVIRVGNDVYMRLLSGNWVSQQTTVHSSNTIQNMGEWSLIHDNG